MSFDRSFKLAPCVSKRCDNIKEPCMSWIPSVAVPYNEKPTVITYSGTLLRYCVVVVLLAWLIVTVNN